MTAAFLGGVSCRLTCNSATTKKRSEWLQVAGFDTIFQRWRGFFFLFHLLSFASLAFSMEELESLIVTIIIIRVSCVNWLDHCMLYMAKTEEFEEKIKRSTSCEEVEKF